MTLLTVSAALVLACGAANAKPARCELTWNADQQATTVKLLRSKFADPYKVYDLRRPGMVLMFFRTMQTPSGPKPIPRHNVTWASFEPAEGAPPNTPAIVVAYDLCSGEAIGYHILSEEADAEGRPHD